VGLPTLGVILAAQPYLPASAATGSLQARAGRALDAAAGATRGDWCGVAPIAVEGEDPDAELATEACRYLTGLDVTMREWFSRFHVPRFTVAFRKAKAVESAHTGWTWLGAGSIRTVYDIAQNTDVFVITRIVVHELFHAIQHNQLGPEGAAENSWLPGQHWS